MPKLNLLALLLAFACMALTGTSLARAEDSHAGHDHGDGGHEAESAETSDPYYFSVSPTGKALGSDPLIEVHDGRELRFANKADAAAFHAGEEKYLAELDKKIIADQAPLYPLDVCPITDEPLDSMGGIVDYVHGNRLVRFCCAGCIGEFESDPAKYLAVIDAAIVAKQGADYPLPTCIVLPEQAFEPENDLIVGGRLFRLCCGGCAKKVLGAPAEWVSQLDAAWAKN